MFRSMYLRLSMELLNKNFGPAVCMLRIFEVGYHVVCAQNTVSSCGLD
jgi:hypothetical protein